MSGLMMSRSLVVLRPGLFRAAVQVVASVARAVSTRRELAAMDDRMLADIGISRADAHAEAQRAPWDVTPRRPR